MYYNGNIMKKSEDLISWSNTLACGIKLIDDQHKNLVELVNEMHQFASGNASKENFHFKRGLQEAVKYARIHFSTEEKIMIAAKFSGYTEHKKAHEKFILSIIEFIKDYEAGKRLTLSTFTRFLKDWIFSHIACMDKVYFEHLKKMATRKEDGRLSIKLDNPANTK